MLRVLFWNINKKRLADSLRSLCDSHKVDVLILAECNLSDEELLPALNQHDERTFLNPGDVSEKLKFFVCLPITAFRMISDTHHCAIRAVTTPAGTEILLAAIHFPSKLHKSGIDQAQLMTRIAEQIRDAEARREHTRTVVVGDLNMNPFELGVCSAEGLHAVMCKQLAREEERKVDGVKRRYFYNPMWNFLGDETRGPPGTYYYRSSAVTTYFWNMFDQVLYRPALLCDYHSGDVSVITEIGNKSLLCRGRIASEEFSDHLPVFFQIRA